MNLMLFLLWEDTRVWALWNHSFDMHLTSLGPVSCVFPSWVSSLGVCAVADNLMVGILPLSCIPSEFTVGRAVMRRLNGYNILCLLILLQEGGPLPGPKTGLLSNTQKWIVQGDTCADKARDFIGKRRLGGEQQVREPRRTATWLPLLCG